MVRFDFKNLPKEYHNGYPFKKEDRFIYLGEIRKAPGHCIVIKIQKEKSDEIYSWYHTDNFVEVEI